jgi:NCAIR mutase (PurE)-related protein
VTEPADGELPFATLDLDRARRQGAPEVVFGEGKSPDQCVAIAERLVTAGQGVLLTRTSDAARQALHARFPDARVHAVARTVRLAPMAPRAAAAGFACVVTAGTSDLPVAEECLETLAFLGVSAERVTDVGVAGVHRVLARADLLRAARAVVVIAGMDGALPSVVGGLVAGPVIAVPTSVGYGAAFGGLAPLLTMLNSCAAGVTVVNIDNGFGAAMAVWRLLAGEAVEHAPSK